MSLFNANIDQKIYDGFKGKLLKGTLTRTVLGEYDPVTDSRTKTPTDYSFEGFVDDYNERMIANGVVNVNDREISILARSIAVEPNGGDNDNDPDEITIDGGTYTVISTKTDPANAMWIVQGRL